MTKNILLAQIKRKDMGLSVKKLLDEYFSKEDVQDALRDIGESTSGTKDELVQRLRSNWESHNRDIYELLDFTEEDSLHMICYHYRLDPTPADHGVLKRRIKKANLLGTGKKPTAHVNRSHDSFITKPKPSSIVDEILSYSKKPKINTEENSEPSHVHFHISSVTPSRRWLIGIAIAVASIIVTIIFSI